MIDATLQDYIVAKIIAVHIQDQLTVVNEFVINPSLAQSFQDELFLHTRARI
jgi:hypothetical protein